MKVITIEDPRIYLVPRVFPELTDVITAELINEETNVITVTPSLIWTIENQLVKIIVFEPENMIPQCNYEISIYNGSELIYKGKIVRVDNDTNIQDFNPQNQNTARWE